MCIRIWCSGKFYSQGLLKNKINLTTTFPASLRRSECCWCFSCYLRDFFLRLSLGYIFVLTFWGCYLNQRKKKKERENRQKLPALGKENFASSWFSWQPETLGAMYSAVTPCCIEDPVAYRNHKRCDRKFGMKFAGFTREWLLAVHPELLHQQEFFWWWFKSWVSLTQQWEKIFLFQ